MMLFDPIQVGGVELKNRAACTAHLAFPLAYHPDGSVQDYLAYVRTIADGGVGMFTLQSLRVRPVGGPYAFAYDYVIPRWKELAAAVHECGGRVMIQLQHFGARQRGDADPDLTPIWAMRASTSPQSGEGVHAMTDEEIGWLVEGYGRATEAVLEAGIDGVELAGSHGYLMYQVVSVVENGRADGWGDPLALWIAVLKRIRAVIGSSGIVGARVCSDDMFPDGVGRDGLREFAVSVAATGLVDYLNPTHGAHPSHYVRSVGTFRRPHGDFLADAAAIRAATGGDVRVLGAGRITTIEQAERALQSGQCDLVGITRAHIADPLVLRKAAEGRADRIRPCVGSNQGCIDRVNAGYAMTCFHNPDVGRERRVSLQTRAATPRRVLVVGAGPAGLRAAETAARRGHVVTLADLAASVGGRLSVIGPQTSAVELLGSIRHIERELEDLSVEVLLSTRVDEPFMRRFAPDAVILATGASPAPTPFASDDSIPILSTAEAVRHASRFAGKSVLIYDQIGNEESDITWEQLAAAGSTIIFVTPNSVVGAHLGHTHVQDIVPRLLQQGCAVAERTTIVEVSKGVVAAVQPLARQEVRWTPDAIVLATRGVPEVGLHDTARAVCSSVHVVGDAFAARSALHAFREGDNAGRAV